MTGPRSPPAGSTVGVGAGEDAHGYWGTTARRRTDGGGTPIKIGVLVPFSGGLGWIGPNVVRGMETALDDDGERATVLGQPVELVERDTHTRQDLSHQAHQSLLDEGVTAVVGTSSTTAPGLVAEAQDSGVPLVTPMAGTVQLDDTGGEYVWRTVPSDTVGARAQATYAYEELGCRSMSVAYKNDLGSKSFSTTAGRYFEQLGGTVVDQVALPTAAYSYEAELSQLADSGVDVVSVTAGTEVSRLFVRQYLDAGLDDEFLLCLGNDIVQPEFLTTLGNEDVGTLYAQAPSHGPAYDTFRSRHMQRHGTEPGSFAAPSYDALTLLALAFVSAGQATPETVPKEFPRLTAGSGETVSTFEAGADALDSGAAITYEGAANPQTFDETGDPLGPFCVFSATDGGWEPVRRYTASELSQPD